MAVTAAEKKDFLEKFVGPVINQCKLHGWGVPSAIIGQAANESRWGLSKLSTECHNYWGMKWVPGCGCDYKEYQTKEQKTDGTVYTIIAKFRKYNSVEEGINGYFQFIESYKRYKPVMQAKTAYEYATQLKQCGWATSIVYTQSIMSTINANNLLSCDTGIIPTIVEPPVIEGYVIGKVYTLDSDLYIRESPSGNKIDYLSITTNAQLNAFTDVEGYSILKKGTRVTCKNIQNVDGSIWMQIPSGWVCAFQKSKNKTYIK